MEYIINLMDTYKEYFKYTVKNKLIFKEITRKAIIELKK